MLDTCGLYRVYRAYRLPRGRGGAISPLQYEYGYIIYIIIYNIIYIYIYSKILLNALTIQFKILPFKSYILLLAISSLG